MAYCKGCIEKDLKIEELKEAVRLLQAKLRYRTRKEEEGYFGASTPSSRMPFKENAPEENTNRKGGGVPGHAGHGRPVHTEETADRIMDLDTGATCPDCGGSSHREGRKKSHGDRKRAFKAGEAPLSPSPQGVHGLPEGVESQASFGAPEKSLRQRDHRADRLSCTMSTASPWAALRR